VMSRRKTMSRCFWSSFGLLCCGCWLDIFYLLYTMGQGSESDMGDRGMFMVKKRVTKLSVAQTGRSRTLQKPDCGCLHCGIAKLVPILRGHHFVGC
jgi:hypothetical protein